MGEPWVYDDIYNWCTYRSDVDCGSRPCNSPANCATKPPPTTTPATVDCGHYLNCTDMSSGYYADPYNCRKYWHCDRVGSKHMICPNDPDTGEPEMFDMVWMGCNFGYLTDCGERPICDECDQDCVTPPPTTVDCGHTLDCSTRPDGWYADPYNCRKYWHCAGKVGQHFMCDAQLEYNPALVQC